MFRLVVLSSFLFSTALGFSTGAGGCEVGPAVGGPHLTNAPVVNTTLAEAGLNVTMNTVVLDPSLNSISIENGEVFYDIRIVNSPDTTTPVEFRGFLIRAALDDGTKGILLDPPSGMNAQVATVCTGAVKGVTHTDNSPKTTAGAIFGSPTEGGSLALDVTVVFSNNANEGSRYAHQQYILTVVAELPTIPTVPTEVITLEPSATPSVGPSSAPSMVPPTATPVTLGPGETYAPTAVATTASPTGAPVAGSDAPTTEMPATDGTDAPTPMMVDGTTSAPTTTPMISDTAEPTPAPVPDTTPAPVEAPTSAANNNNSMGYYYNMMRIVIGTTFAIFVTNHAF